MDDDEVVEEDITSKFMGSICVCAPTAKSTRVRGLLRETGVLVKEWSRVFSAAAGGHPPWAKQGI
jgi:hypothetical protein